MATKKTTANAAAKPVAAKAVAAKAIAKKPVVKRTTAKPVAKVAAKKPIAKKPVAKKVEAVAPKQRGIKAFGAFGAFGKILRKPAVLVVLLLVVVGAVALAAVDRKTDGQPQSGDAYQRELQSQVENADGTPMTGRDPASQGQNSLATAASSPAGPGQRTDAPAAGATGNSGANTSGTTSNTSDGIGSNGCFIDYGVQGQQCLPAYAAGDDKVLSCAEVNKVKGFEQGIKVVGTDRFHLDHDSDKLACEPGEAAHAH